MYHNNDFEKFLQKKCADVVRGCNVDANTNMNSALPIYLLCDLPFPKGWSYAMELGKFSFLLITA
jgi:hypothetical protein